jgi:hypothetical protein
VPEPWGIGGELTDEVLNREVFSALKEAKVVIENWQRDYNTIGPHSSLNCRRPPAPRALLPFDFQRPWTTGNSPAPSSGSFYLDLCLLPSEVVMERRIEKVPIRSLRGALPLPGGFRVSLPFIKFRQELTATMLRREAGYMPTYIGLFKLTDHGIKEIKAAP